MKGYSLLVLFIALSFTGFSQKGFEVGGFAGISNYIGDINPYYSLKTPGPTIGAIGRYDFNNRTALRLDIAAGRLIGKDSLSENSFQQSRNLSFRTDYVDAALNMEINFFPMIHGSRDHYFTPYVFAGLAWAYYNPKANLDDTWYALRDMGTEGQREGDEYSQISFGLSYGMGFKVDLTDEWSLNVEVCARQMATDYLDDVSTVYPNMDELAARRGDVAVRLSDRSVELGIEPIGTPPGRQRGVSEDNDSYYSIRVGVVYYIGLLLCPDISKPHL